MQEVQVKEVARREKGRVFFRFDNGTEFTLYLSLIHISLVMYGAPVRAGENFGTRKSFSDIAATILSYFDLTPECAGERCV